MSSDLGADPAFVASATEPVSRLGLSASIRALAERCERATGDDVLDLINLECDICHALGVDTSHEAPFTSSFDAALTLVPEGWQVKHLSELDDRGGWQCQLVAPYDWSPRPFILADWCGTPALALTTAALRARAIEAQRAETENTGSVGDESASA